MTVGERAPGELVESRAEPALGLGASTFGPTPYAGPELLAVVNGSLQLDSEVDGVPVAYVRPWELSSLLTAS